MKKLMLNNQLQKWLQQRTSSPRHRQLVTIEGGQNWACEQALECLLANSSVLWCGDMTISSPSNIAIKPIQSSQYHQCLGGEYDAVVYNCYSGIRANALAALSGTVKRAGIMILVCPPFHSWPRFPDPQKQLRISYGFTEQNDESLFIHWFMHAIEQHAQRVHISQQNTYVGQLSEPEVTHKIQNDLCKTIQQQQALDAIVELFHQPTAPLVITADRGRGKSSVMGLAAAQIIQKANRPLTILVTAPVFSNVSQLFYHAQQQLNAELNRHKLTVGEHKIHFMPVDRILIEKPAADLLLVDEAAAIPAPILDVLSQQYRSIVFASTIHGYEGSGRGFDIRFKPRLKQRFANYQSIELSQPIRWFNHDPLEQFWFDCLLLKSAECADLQSNVIAHKQITFRLISADKLCHSPDLLNQIFSLLVNAHYQTTPDDLVRLLDAPDQLVFVASDQQQLIAAALVSIEGGEKLQTLAQDISAGKRRVKGHLLAQNLGLNCQDENLVTLNYWRIIRIAVQPSVQRQGLGLALLNYLADAAALAKQDFIGSAFAASDDLLKFWPQAGFKQVRQGSKKDASSGLCSAIVLKALSGDAQARLEQMSHDFQQSQIQAASN
ncbi:tRNA(Met) cytidine acetyltransferase TmcA [Neptunicella marina]|uniref:tRNA(Met) cytidine acetyltransferase TmcA n=1 Tax=Neptunicella marina TaxID=2125989 RepID=A0A8J6IRV4_9ALTE|nr:GNAT family N-acetyltransferase [Neptunicella marina]MBC3765119.1 tRNA(Met) cytidine acetyltransferase [Neptunicella marina]